MKIQKIMDGEPKSLEALRAEVRGTNINEQSLLATDYLNHLNEPIMLLEMVADAPELLDELASWQPKTYVEHFADSTFADKELAIRAYAAAPDEYRGPFDETIEEAGRCICAAMKPLSQLAKEGRTEELRSLATKVTAVLGELVDRASSIIHGQVTTLGQSQIDQIMNS